MNNLKLSKDIIGIIFKYITINKEQVKNNYDKVIKNINTLINYNSCFPCKVIYMKHHKYHYLDEYHNSRDANLYWDLLTMF
jgi:hypothetical protein